VAAAGAALAGVTWSALATERAGIEAQRKAAIEGAARVALYRMDWQLAALVGAQVVRPADRFLELARKSRYASALAENGLVQLYFEMKGPDSIVVNEEAVPLMPDFTSRFEYGALMQALEKAETDVIIQTGSMPLDLTFGTSQNEWPNRAQSNAAAQQNIISQQAFGGQNLRTGLMVPLWLQGQLLLVRRVASDPNESVQGCWIDWNALRTALERSVSDLLPAARLAPIEGQAGFHVPYERRLATLPVYLVPGPTAESAQTETGPLRLTLLLAWGCGALAAASIGGLLGAALALSERRATFVSAVTHEMRTPLTTFRLYTDLLAEGSITDEAKRQRYYETLRAEAVRLGHLVENVLASARIERHRKPGKLESVCVWDAIDRVLGSLVQRAAQSGREVKLDGNDDALSTHVHIDSAGFERILMNLVDNACKHGTPARDPLIGINVTREGHWIVIRVADTGPGVAPDVARHLFRAFGRSAHQAAGAAPGIGLGLGLSRRLARRMRGDLRLEKTGPEGTCFTLSIPSR
jgi:signal transduction histidine kinase